MLIKPEVSRFAKIKVLGIGGAGVNAVNSMISFQQIQGVDFVAVNTDAQHLLTCPSPTKVQIGEKLTKGLGAGGDPEIGKEAALESTDRLSEAVSGADMVFITYGAGGGTGSGAAPVVAEVAKKAGVLTVAVVTKPFLFEGTKRMLIAEDSVDELKSSVDTLIVIPNQRLLEVIDQKMSLTEAFKVSDSVLSQGVQGISDLVVMPGLVNVDFADVKAIMTDAGSALMGIGIASGEGRAEAAARAAVASPLLEVSIDGAKGILFNVTGGQDLTMTEVDQAAQIITRSADPDAQIIFGTAIDDKLVDQLKITVIATGFDESRRKLKEFAAQQEFASEEKAEEEEEETDGEKPEIPPKVQDKIDVPAFLRGID